MLSLGADFCNSARGFMFAVGCIQSRSCHTNKCPTGVATQDPYRQKALHVPDKAQRVYNFHKNTLKALAGILGAVGVTHPQELKPYHIARRLEDGRIKLLAQHYYFTFKGVLFNLSARADIYNRMWVMANPDDFRADYKSLVAYDSTVHQKFPDILDEQSAKQKNRINVFDLGSNYYSYQDDPQ